MSKIDFSDCRMCPIRKECRECEVKDLTCEELYEVLKSEENISYLDGSPCGKVEE